MKKDDYKMDFEAQRKEIDLADDERIISRVDLHRKNKTPKKRSRLSLINVLLILFTLIPIGIFTFVIISLNTSKEPITPKENDEGIQFETIEKPDLGGVAIVDKDEEKEDKKKAEEEEKKKKEALEKEKKAEEEKKAKEASQKEEEARKMEAQRQEEARQQEIARQKEQERQQAEKEKKEAEANKNQNDGNQQAGGKTHTVAPGETLYRISVNYYQTGDGVEKIKQANGLSSNSISVGQKLVIP